LNKQECQELIDAYLAWLGEGISVESLENACELTTPFLDRHNDHLQVYAVKRGGSILLTDDGYVLSDLRTSGLDMNTPKRKSTLQLIINGFGVRRDGNQLTIEASVKNLGQRIHSLVQAMLAVNDMFVLSQPRVATYFWEDVKSFLDEHLVRYSTRIKIAGKSGYDHAIDFLIPKSHTRSERFLQAINVPNKNTISSYLFSLTDSREIREEDIEAYAFLNDRDGDVGGEIVEALQSYQVKPALWSRREEYVSALTA